jgi:hypothetical protein
MFPNFLLQFSPPEEQAGNVTDSEPSNSTQLILFRSPTPQLQPRPIRQSPFVFVTRREPPVANLSCHLLLDDKRFLLRPFCSFCKAGEIPRLLPQIGPLLSLYLCDVSQTQTNERTVWFVKVNLKSMRSAWNYLVHTHFIQIVFDHGSRSTIRAQPVVINSLLSLVVRLRTSHKLSNVRLNQLAMSPHLVSSPYKRQQSHQPIAR